jgi:hypothetical protein
MRTYFRQFKKRTEVPPHVLASQSSRSSPRQLKIIVLLVDI